MATRITSDEGLSDLAAILSEKEQAVQKCQESIREAKEARAAEAEAHALLPTTPTDSKLEQQPSFNQAASKARRLFLLTSDFCSWGLLRA